jgi:hypothetical protein
LSCRLFFHPLPALLEDHALPPMSTADIPLEPKAKTFGMIGVIVGFLGLLSVLIGPVIRDAIIPPPPAEKQLAETIVSLKQHITAKLKKTPPPAESPRQRFSAQELPGYSLLCVCRARDHWWSGVIPPTRGPSVRLCRLRYWHGHIGLARAAAGTRGRRSLCDPRVRPAGCFVLMQRTAVFASLARGIFSGPAKIPRVGAIFAGVPQAVCPSGLRRKCTDAETDLGFGSESAQRAG